MISAYGKTDRGVVRGSNQDACAHAVLGPKRAWGVVCDGMGGHSFGEVASSVCIQALTESIRTAYDTSPVFVLEQAINSANLEVRKASDRLRSNGMGTTLVMAAVQDRTAYIANIGDSRLYVISREAGTITQITRDHSLVEEQVAKGLLDRNSRLYSSQKNVITRAVGVYSEPDPDFFEVQIEDDTIFLLCSDGLTNVVSDREIMDEVIKGGTPDNCCERLVETVLRRGAPDNVTVVLFRK